MCVVEMSVDKMSVDEMSVDSMSFGIMLQDEMPVYNTSVDTYCQQMKCLLMKCV